MAIVEAPNPGRGNANPIGGRNGGRGRGRGRVARAHGQGRGQRAHTNAVLGEPTMANEVEESRPSFLRQLTTLATIHCHPDHC